MRGEPNSSQAFPFGVILSKQVPYASARLWLPPMVPSPVGGTGEKTLDRGTPVAPLLERLLTALPGSAKGGLLLSGAGATVWGKGCHSVALGRWNCTSALSSVGGCGGKAAGQPEGSATKRRESRRENKGRKSEGRRGHEQGGEREDKKRREEKTVTRERGRGASLGTKGFHIHRWPGTVGTWLEVPTSFDAASANAHPFFGIQPAQAAGPSTQAPASNLTNGH